jgi:hypothetical protein
MLRELEEVLDEINQAQATNSQRGVGKHLDRAWDVLWPVIQELRRDDAARERDTIQRAEQAEAGWIGEPHNFPPEAA